jgi:hypothetical protein
VFAGSVAGSLRRERQARRAVGCDGAKCEPQRAALRRGIRERHAVERGAARHVGERVGQQDEDFCVGERHAVRCDLGRVLEALRLELGRQRQARFARRRRFLCDDEVRGAERAAAQVEELRQRVAGAAHPHVAAQWLELRGQRDRVELHDVRARRHALEVILAFIVGNGVSAVLEVDAHAGDSRACVDRGSAGAGVDAAQHEGGAREQLLAQQHGRARRARDGAAVGVRNGAVDECAIRRAGRDDGDVAERRAALRCKLRQAERQREPVEGDFRLERRRGVEARRARLIAHAGGQRVRDDDVRQGCAVAAVAHRDGVRHEVADRGDVQAGALVDQQSARGRIERHVDRLRNLTRDRDDAAERRRY